MTQAVNQIVEPDQEPSFNESESKANAKQEKLVAELKADRAAAPVKTARRLLQHDLKRSDIAAPQFRITVQDMNVTLEDMLQPEYWTNVGRLLSETIKRWPFAEITAVWADGSRYVRLLVMDAGDLWAMVKVLEDKKFDAVQDESAAILDKIEANTDYEVKRLGPALNWCVVRKSDKTRIRTGIGSKEEAQKELQTLIRSVTRYYRAAAITGGWHG